jgi:probable addiction module antidote protein
MKVGRNYKEGFLKALREPKQAAAYLNAALEDGDPRMFLLALRNIAEAQGNMTALAKKCALPRGSLYKMTSGKALPSIDNILKITRCLGLNFSFQPKKSKIRLLKSAPL